MRPLPRRVPGWPAGWALAVGRGVLCNAMLPTAALDSVAPLAGEARDLLHDRSESGTLSGRGLDSVRRVARTLADLDGPAQSVEYRHVAEALSLRAAREIPGCPGLAATVARLRCG